VKLAIEIRPGEGGDEAKNLVLEQSAIYQRFALRIGAAIEISLQPS
jgi:protein subunit release factor A